MSTFFSDIYHQILDPSLNEYCLFYITTSQNYHVDAIEDDIKNMK
jgi:putative component of membrane protein insertase Oxa1/YidC/SpoIIIJ protein YidD